MSDLDIFCGIAELQSLPAEHTRMALECVARLAGKSHVRALEAACWCAGHADAAVRDGALEAGDTPKCTQTTLQQGAAVRG